MHICHNDLRRFLSLGLAVVVSSLAHISAQTSTDIVISVSGCIPGPPFAVHAAIKAISSGALAGADSGQSGFAAFYTNGVNFYKEYVGGGKG